MRGTEFKFVSIDEAPTIEVDWLYTLPTPIEIPVTNRGPVEDALIPQTLQQLYVMNGCRFPFTAVKVVETRPKGANILLPMGTIKTFYSHDAHRDGTPAMFNGTSVTDATLAAWLFADGDVG